MPGVVYGLLEMATGAAKPLLAVAAALTAGHGPARPAAVPGAPGAARVHFAAGRHAASLVLPEPAGVILLYRISADAGTNLRAWVRVPRVTVPLAIGTGSGGPVRSCSTARRRIVCTQGEEWCPMPQATWQVRIVKLAGPAGDVRIRLRVGDPPDAAAA